MHSNSDFASDEKSQTFLLFGGADKSDVQAFRG